MEKQEEGERRSKDERRGKKGREEKGKRGRVFFLRRFLKVSFWRSLREGLSPVFLVLDRV